ncbi:MAG: glycoside hydrolase [Elusimicrobia bacterium]|nr:glycoside hydrolase [Elusimicrobiota bacterium]
MNKIYLAFLWHQHQPFYKDLRTDRAILPWVRLHATKDYYDMAALLEEFPKVRMNVNLVPSLLAQLEDYAETRCMDSWLEKSLIPAKDLTVKDQCWILENFFFCNWETMIFPNPRYSELFEKRGKYASRFEIERTRTYFSAQDFLDLQVWFNLAWMDPLWKEKDPLVSHLCKKGRDFSEGEKIMLLEKQKEICGLTTPKHKELWEKGQIEVTTTPFYHPILPLLCDTDSAQMAMPGSLKPKTRFQHPEDAQHQIEQALLYMERAMGRRPKGMWPSEGSVSDEMIPIVAESGIQWLATDEGILFNSLRMMGEKTQRSDLYQPYWIDLPSSGKKIQMIFRDHALSDALGFVYARTDPRKAVEDLLNRILKIGESSGRATRPLLVPIILDGENCWEHYRNDGHDFLKMLYAALSNHPVIETTTISQYLEKFPAERSLTKLWSGSWINSNFSIWIGHHEDNRAWDLVSEARKFLTEYDAKHPEKKEDIATQKAWESLYIAEGSDWCWWYGDQNSTAHDSVFDELFRNHIKNVYLFLGENPPEKVNIAIKGKEQKGLHLAPVALITPKVDGLVTNYYEWRSGGSYQTALSGGTMHQAEAFLSAMHYGFDLENMYLRMDTKIPLYSKEIDLSETKIKVTFIEPQDHEIQIEWEPNLDSTDKTAPLLIKAILLNSKGETTRLSQIAGKKIIECAIPFSLISTQINEPVEFALTILKNGLQMERWPHQSSIRFTRPTEQFDLDYWTA